jgi:glycosyltransferase involved in cell wall biosynthesis
MVKNFISVIIPAHNEERVISKAINSVLASTYKNYEIIVVNNGSTDRTRQMAEAVAQKHPKRIRLLNFPPENEKEFARKRGPAFSRNRGAEVAKGDILFFLDADDWVRSDTLEKIIEAFNKYKEIDFIVGDRQVEIPKSWRRILISYWIWRKKFSLKPERISYTEPLCPYIMKTKIFFKIGKFNENTYFHEDIIFRLKLEKLKIPYLISKTIRYHTDMGSQVSDFKRQANSMAKSLMAYRFKSIGIYIQILLFFLSFSTFYLILFSIFIWRSGDIFIGIFSPFIWIIRRILELYYQIKLSMK